jgi:hypothetical protein
MTEPLVVPERSRPWRWWAAGVLAVAALALGGLYADAEISRRDERRRVADLTVQRAALEAQATALRARTVELEQQLAVEQARFAAVEPCLRQVVTPPPAKPLTQKELDQLLKDLILSSPRSDGIRIGAIESPKTVPLTEMLPGCKDVGRQLR